jgi:putative membrane protein
MPTAVNGQLYYSQDEVRAGLPQYHEALRQATGYSGQFSADPTQKFQQYISGATPERQAASNALSNIYGSGSFAPGTTTVVQPSQTQQAPDLSPIQTGITGLETGQQGLMTGQQNLQTGITDLGTGQQGLMTGQENIQTGITDLGISQQGILGGQQALGAGQGAIQGSIGAPAEGQPQTLFSGQAGLMGGQQALGQQLTGGIQDITGAVGGVSQNIDALERAAQQYQREAQRQRTQIQTAGIQGRDQLSQQVSDVGQQVNTGVEQQRSLMGGLAAPVAAMGATAGIQPGGATQAATQYAQTQKFAPPAQGQQTIMGPMGPMTVDPRDQVTRPVSSSGLMNYPV